MRLLLTTDTVGGVWTYALELARALAPHGVQVALATMGSPLTAEMRRDAERVPDLEVYESAFKLEWMHEPWNDVRDAGQWLLALEQKVRPDVVHLNGYAHGALPWRAPTLVVAHSCVLTWWRAVKGEDAPPNWDRYRHEVTRGLRAADRVVAPSQAMLDALLNAYGPLPCEPRVIHNGRNPIPFGKPAIKEEFILTAGRVWDEAKNVRALVSVADQIAWPVCVAGEDKHPEGGAAHTGNLRPLGRLSLEALAPWFRRASIYAVPARYEPFGLTALEAALAGCALVLGDIPSLREVWGDAATFVPPDDHDGLAAALNRLIGDPEARAEMASRARTRASHYTPERMARGYMALYEELMAERSKMTEASHTLCVGPGYQPVYYA